MNTATTPTKMAVSVLEKPPRAVEVLHGEDSKPRLDDIFGSSMRHGTPPAATSFFFIGESHGGYRERASSKRTEMTQVF
jgi:hypothetical protein